MTEKNSLEIRGSKVQLAFAEDKPGDDAGGSCMGSRGSGSINGSGLRQTTAQVSPATVGRGQSAPGSQAPAPGSYQPAPGAYQSDTSNRGRGTPRGRVRGRGREGPPRGRDRGRGYWNDHGFFDNNIDYNSGYHGGDGGYYEDWHSGPRGRGYYGNQGRGRGYYPPLDRSYADDHYGPYPHHPDPRMLGRGMQFPAYVTAAPTYYGLMPDTRLPPPALRPGMPKTPGLMPDTRLPPPALRPGMPKTPGLMGGGSRD